MKSRSAGLFVQLSVQGRSHKTFPTATVCLAIPVAKKWPLPFLLTVTRARTHIRTWNPMQTLFSLERIRWNVNPMMGNALKNDSHISSISLCESAHSLSNWGLKQHLWLSNHLMISQRVIEATLTFGLHSRIGTHEVNQAYRQESISLVKIK